MKWLLVFIFISLNLFGKSYDFTNQNTQISVDFDENWLYLEKVLGVPYLMLSKTNPPKDSVSITPTKQEKVELDPKKLKETQNDYQTGRKNWAQKNNIKILKFHDYEFKKINENLNIHQIGFDYINEKNTFTEQSFYLFCYNDLYHLKSSVYQKRKVQNISIKEAILSSTCQKLN